MWPEKIKNKNVDGEIEKLVNRFGTAIFSDWVDRVFDNETLEKAGADYLLSIGNCEHCRNYTGVNPVLKKVFNISVISGFCEFYKEGIRNPTESVCSFFDPSKIDKMLILIKLEEKHKLNKW